MESIVNWAERLSYGAKLAWAMVAFTFLFIFMPALVASGTPSASEKEPKKTVYTSPMMCYPGEISDKGKKLICDFPETPSGLNQRMERVP